MIYYRKKGIISIAENWYTVRENPEKRVDVVKYRFVSEPCDRALFLENLFTILIDLKKEQDELFFQIGKNTRYKINRAKDRDDIECSTFLSAGKKDDEKLRQYITYFNGFTATKRRSSIEYSDLEQFYNAGTLCLRCAACKDGSKVYTMHAYIVSDGRARLHQSSSHFRASDDSEFRNLIGRANRYLHWDDILYFKGSGLDYYDFGGWYGGQSDTEKLAINQFKESFGGEKQKEFTYIVPATLRGKIAVFLQQLVKKRKKDA
jgi:lipid II:glycine glycyltransferase (peptidoglycan interpeptide bridge formation enzyme)